MRFVSISKFISTFSNCERLTSPVASLSARPCAFVRSGATRFSFSVYFVLCIPNSSWIINGRSIVTASWVCVVDSTNQHYPSPCRPMGKVPFVLSSLFGLWSFLTAKPSLFKLDRMRPSAWLARPNCLQCKLCIPFSLDWNGTSCISSSSVQWTFR